MISIIVCSVNLKVFENAKQNIKETIGIEHEVIRIDNKEGIYGICEAYNKGANQASYEFLLFLHEDVEFISKNWGIKLLEILKDDSIGLVGLAGGIYKSKYPSGWSDGVPDFIRKNIIQVREGSDIKEVSNPKYEQLTDVVMLDGVFLCTRKSIWESRRFDAYTFKEFHFYDIDFSLTISKNYRVCVTYEIEMKHFSTGNRNESWTKNALIFDQKWRTKLPISVKKVDAKLAKKHHQLQLSYFINKLISQKCSKKIILKHTLKYIYLCPFSFLIVKVLLYISIGHTRYYKLKTLHLAQ